MKAPALRPIRRLGIVNRGEAALRCVRAAKALAAREDVEIESAKEDDSEKVELEFEKVEVTVNREYVVPAATDVEMNN